MIHICSDGSKIKLSSMSYMHLINTIGLLGRKAEAGFIIEEGGGTCPDDYWYDRYEIKGQEALEHLGYVHYIEELNNRTKEVKL